MTNKGPEKPSSDYVILDANNQEERRYDFFFLFQAIKLSSLSSPIIIKSYALKLIFSKKKNALKLSDDKPHKYCEHFARR